MGYIHANPVRAGLCECPAEYRWNSAWLWEDDRFAGDPYELDVFASLQKFRASS